MGHFCQDCYNWTDDDSSLCEECKAAIREKINNITYPVEIIA
jgi:predicted nucleic acid-binding Zn ribbon protein